MGKTGFVYILASKRNGTLYIGVTSDLVRRIWQHRQGNVRVFTQKYGCKILVYFEEFADITDASQCEKSMKEWKRAWKMRLIEESNPQWHDLWETISAL